MVSLSRRLTVVVYCLFFGTLLYSQEQPLFHAAEGAIFLLDRADTRVWDNGRVETLIRQKVKIVGEKGKKFGELQISFDSERQTVSLISARTVTSRGTVIPLSPKSARIVTPAELVQYAILYPGVKTLTATFPGVDIGCVLEYEYRLVTFKPLIENQFWDGFYFQSTEPFVHSVYSLTVPKNKKIYVKEIGVRAKDVKEDMLWKTYVWEKENMPSVVPEPLMPPVAELVPRVYVTTFGSWGEITDWFTGISRESFRESPELRKTVEELTAGKTTEDKIRAVYNYVSSNIRYVGLEIGIHGFKPHAADEVFRYKYGDCKDKATLLITMLKAAGVEAYLTLIHTEQRTMPDLPFPGQFNHAIVAVAVPGGYRFLDPTSEVFRYPSLPPSDQDRKVLVAFPGAKSLLDTPLSRPEEECRIRNITAEIHQDGRLDAQVDITPLGLYEAGIRSGFRYLKDVERRRALGRDLNSIFPGTELKSLEVGGMNDLATPVTERYTFTAKNYGIPVGNKIIFQPVLVDRMRDTGIVSEGKRTYPIRFDYLMRTEESVIYRLPAGFKVDTVPPSVAIDTKFGLFSLLVKDEGTSLSSRRVFTAKINEISAEDYPEFKQFYESISLADRLPVILTQQP